MLTNPQLYLLFLGVAVLVFWLLPASRPRLRQFCLIVFSCVVVFTVAPYAILIVLGLSAFAIGANQFLAKEKRPFPLLLTFVLIAGIPLFWIRFEDTVSSLVSIGLSFAVLKAVGLLVTGHLQRKTVSWWDGLTLMTFFPAFPSGPIEVADRFSSGIISRSLNWQFAVNGIVRISLGLFRLLFLAPVILVPIASRYGADVFTPAYEGSGLDVILYCIVAFSVLYVSFSGYSDVAIGSGLLFGIELGENFNKPFLARNIIEFWQRWHMSLGRWVNAFFYMPVVRNTGKVYLPIFAIFLFIGFWHSSSFNYLIWGALHGICLVSTQLLKKGKKKRGNEEVSFSDRLRGIGGWAFTMVFVTVLSAFANAPTLQEGGQLLVNLISF
ncbi:MAG: hypothetical protein MI807_23240 [Verrucomicrobiales bacterium]|nr:hypothetical protein [Verrucomicrobiales bacterium]